MRPSDEQVRELQKIALKGQGILTPQAFVDAARPEKAVLHGLFEWDDKLAGEQYRLGQARAIISWVEVRTKTTTIQQEVYSYVRDPSLGRTQGYIDIRSQRAEDNRLAISAYYVSLAEGMLRRALTIADELQVSHPFRECLDRMGAWRAEAQVDIDETDGNAA